jgi:hypothetical protein
VTPPRPQSRREAAETPAPEMSSPPPSGAGGEYSGFIWQQLNEMRGLLGEVKSAIDQQRLAIEKLDTKADETKDKIQSINIKMAVAAAIVAVVFSVTAFVLKEVWDVLKPAVVQRLTTDPNQITPSAARPPAAPASK